MKESVDHYFHWRVLGIIFAASLIVVFQSCTPAEYNYVDQFGSTLDSGPNFDDVDLIAKACEDASLNGHLQLRNFHLDLPNPKDEMGTVNTCNWGKNGNGLPNDTYFMARHEQTRLFPLPEKAVLCDLEMVFPQQKFKFDDHFFFTLNGFIIATDVAYTLNRFDQIIFTPIGENKELNLRLYNWNSIYQLKWPNDTQSGRHNYCLGESNNLSHCHWPSTQQTGNIRMDFSNKIIQPLGLLGEVNNMHEIRLVVTGDNDNETDCKHEPIELMLKAWYIIP